METPGIVRFYDRLGRRYDWFSFYEGRAKELARTWLTLRPGLRLLNVGVGTGKEHAQLQEALAPIGFIMGVDLSSVMVSLAKERSQGPHLQADARALPIAAECFDRIYCAYVLDLLPTASLLNVLAGFRRVLKRGGQAVILSLTEGIDLPSRTLVAAWKKIYALNPLACGGCRPLQLVELAEAAGFTILKRQVVVQLAVPSELILAFRP